VWQCETFILAVCLLTCNKYVKVKTSFRGLQGRIMAYPMQAPWITPVFFGEVRVAYLFNFLCCVFCFVCLRPVSCMPNVASISGLSIPHCPFDFL